MTIPLNLLNRAQLADADAIAALINEALHTQAIRARVQVDQRCLQVMLKSAVPLDQHATVAFLRRGLLRLQPAAIEDIRVYSWQLGRDFPHWITAFSLSPCASADSPEPAIVRSESPLVSTTASPAVANPPAAVVASPLTAPIRSSKRPAEVLKFGVFAVLVAMAYFVVISM